MNKNKTNKFKNRFFTITPLILFYFVVIVFLLLGIAAIIVIIVLFVDEFQNNGNNKTGLIVGLSSALFSAGILTNALGTFIRNTSRDKKMNDATLKNNVSLLIDDFNSNIINDIALINKITKDAILSLQNVEFRFDILLTNQDDAIQKFESSLKNKSDYLDAMIVSAARYYTICDKVFDNKDLYSYCLKIATKKIKPNIKTYGSQEIISIFRQKRIKIFNFFEKIALQYYNNIADRDLLISQFATMISDIVKLCFYDMYITEGNTSYPNLQLLCIQIKEKTNN